VANPGTGQTESGAGQAKQPVKGPGVDARPLPSWGVYARNVGQLTLEDVRLSLSKEDFRPAVMTENVGHLNLENFKYPRVPGVEQEIVTNSLGKITGAR